MLSPGVAAHVGGHVGCKPSTKPHSAFFLGVGGRSAHIRFVDLSHMQRREGTLNAFQEQGYYIHTHRSGGQYRGTRICFTLTRMAAASTRNELANRQVSRLNATRITRAPVGAECLESGTPALSATAPALAKRKAPHQAP